ncbi:MAG TPA: hypothetical protein VIJ95_15540 [Hanamia sp.]
MITEKINHSALVKKIIYSKDNDSCGLYNGKSGKAILLYLMCKSSSDNQFGESALEMLNSVSNSIAGEEQLSFENGLTGIGWAIEWIAQNGFLKINTNDILEEIDDAIYKSVVFGSDKNISLSDGTLGKLLFFLSRYKSRNPDTHRLKNIFHEECLVLLSDDLHEKLLGDGGVFKKETLDENDLLNLGHTIYFISTFLWTRINEPTVEDTLYGVVKFVDNYVDKSINGNIANHALVFLSCCYYLAGKNHKQNYWQERAEKFIRRLNSNLAISENIIHRDKLIVSNKILSNFILEETIIENPNFENDDKITMTNSNGKFLIYSLFRNTDPTDLYIPLLLFV